MRPEVVAAVRQLAREGRTRFRASFVAARAQVPLDDARRDLVALAKVGDLAMRFELMCPSTGDTVETFAATDRIPKKFSSYDCDDGDEFEVTPELLWVTFTPTDELTQEVERDAATVPDEGGGPAPGKAVGPRWGRARARISRSTSGPTGLSCC